MTIAACRRGMERDMSDNMNVTDSSPSLTEGMDALAELNDLFSGDDKKIKESEANVLSQNITGFASCFPDWDLHPPVA